jgi:hypothetical protein
MSSSRGVRRWLMALGEGEGEEITMEEITMEGITMEGITMEMGRETGRVGKMEGKMAGKEERRGLMGMGAS